MMDATSYQAAEKLLRHNRAKLVRNDRIRPRWIDGGTRFWYLADGRFLLVDPAQGTREPAFDHDRLAAALATASGQEVDPSALPFAAVELDAGAVAFDAFGAHWRCPLDTYACEQAHDDRPHQGFLEVVSPDGKLVVFEREDDLWVRQAGQERPLTTDGEPDRAYGATTFSPTVLPNRLGLKTYLPPTVHWSPDSARVFTQRLDLRGVREVPLIDALPPGGGPPKLITQSYSLPGDVRAPLGEFVVLDVATGHDTWVRTEPVPLVSAVTTGWAWWTADSSAVYYLAQPRDLRTLWLNRLDAATGEVRTVLSETGDSRMEGSQSGHQPIIRLVNGGEEVLWWSQRDGWGHLYLYDAPTGNLRGQVTSGQWAVQEILHVDELHRVVYFVASGLVAADPYRRSVCRVGLDGTGFARITDDDLDHVVTVPPGGQYFIDSASTVDTPPSIAVRGWDGRVLAVLEHADIGGLTAIGWTPPERFRVKAADGVTDVYGVLYRPRGFDPERSYPVVDNPYPAQRVSPAFHPGFLGHDAEAVAALGFVVVAIDGRGTPGRDKAFHDVSYGDYAAAGGMADHVAALRQLAADRPWMDLDRVGIFGHSGGGFATVRAMLDHPDFYRVGVAESGNHDNRLFHLYFAEAYDGPDPAAWARSSNVDIADRLRGKLLLIHGGVDDNVHVQHTLRLAERLAIADKDFELLILPGAEHLYVGYEHHLHRRKWDFLVRHLMGIEPPGYRLTPVPLDRNLLADLFS